MTILSKAILATVLSATALTGASPAMAQGWFGEHHHHGDSAGWAVLGGILGLGIGAAIASSSNHRDRDYRYRDGYYDRDGRYYYYRDRRDRYRGDYDRDYYYRRGYPDDGYYDDYGYYDEDYYGGY